MPPALTTTLRIGDPGVAFAQRALQRRAFARANWSTLFSTSTSGLPKPRSQRNSASWSRVRSPAQTYSTTCARKRFVACDLFAQRAGNLMRAGHVGEDQLAAVGKRRVNSA